MAKKIFYDDDARARVLEGAKTLYDAVRVTMGPKGRNVILGKSYGTPTVTHDGVTVAKEIELPKVFKKDEDTLGQNIGSELIKQAAIKMDDAVGDGTTAVTILTYNILAEAHRLIGNGNNPMELRRGLEEARDHVLSKLDRSAVEKITADKKNKITEVAKISANDDQIGKLIADVISKVGKEGVVTVEESQGLEMDSEVVEGFTMDRGYVSPYMVTDPARMEAVYEKPAILITDKKISSIQEFLPILEKAAQAGKKDMVILAEDVEGEALATLVLNKLKGVFNALAIKAPAFGDRRKEILQDIAVLTGGQVISEERGETFETADLSYLGTARKVIADKDNTTIIEGKGSPADLEARIAQIRKQVETATSEYDKENLEKRLAALKGKVAVIRVGGATETEIEEKKFRVDDAVAATKAAISEGIVPGGGITFYNLSEEIKTDEKSVVEAKSAGWVILKSALKQPFVELMRNAGFNPEEKLAQLINRQTTRHGIDVNEPKDTTDMKQAGIIDPAKVVREAIVNAVSVAGTAMTMGALVAELPEEEKGGPPGGMHPGMDM